MKRSLRLSMLVLFFFLSCTVPIASAVDPDVWQGKNISSNLFSTDHEVTSSGAPAYYQIDVTSKSGDEEDEGGNAFTKTFNTVGSWVSGDAIKDEVMAQFYEMMNFIVNIEFKMNLYLTNSMLTILDYAFDFEAVDTIIDRVDSVMQNVTGISQFSFSGAGLYGRFLGLIGVSVALLFAYQFFFRHAQIEAVGNIVKTFLILVASLVLFSNYATVLKGANHLTTEATAYVMGAGTGLHEEGVSGRVSMGNNIWDLFVHRPYLYLQYGTDKESTVGESRVDALLALPPGESRQSYVENNEVAEQQNKMMTYVQVPERLVFTGLYMIVNGITSIPIFILALMIIILQFWFLLIAALAPFFLIIAAFPAGSGIFRRYMEELALPLILKIGVSFLALVIFTMSQVVYDVGNKESMGYIAIGLIEFAVLILFFAIRKRLLSIVFAGSQAARQVAMEASKFDYRMNGMGQMMKHAATMTAFRAIGNAVAGPVGGAAAGTAAGALNGANGGHSNGMKSGSSAGPALQNESLNSSPAPANGALDPDSDYADHVEPMQSESLSGAAGQIGGAAAVGGAATAVKGAAAAAGGSAAAAGVGAATSGAVAGRGSSAAGSAPMMPTVPLQSTNADHGDIPTFLRKRAYESGQTQTGEAGISSSSGAKILPMPGLNSAAASAGSAGSGQGDYDDASFRPQSLSGGGLQTESLSAPSSGAGTIESVPLTSGASGGMAGLESLSSTHEAASGASERGGPSTYNDDSLYASMPNESAQGVTGDSMPPANVSNSGSMPTIVPLNGSRAEAPAGASANEGSVRSAAPNSSSATNQESFRTARGMESLGSTEGSTPVHRTIGDSEVPPARSGGVEDRASTANIALESTDGWLSVEEIDELISRSEAIINKRESGSGEGE